MSIGLHLWLSNKESACSAGAAGGESSITGLGRFPGGENGNPIQYSCLENPYGFSRVGMTETMQHVHMHVKLHVRQNNIKKKKSTTSYLKKS